MNFLSMPLDATDADLKEAVRKFGDLEELERINLFGCRQITDAGLELLKNLTELEDLDLMCCIKITEAGIERLQKALPNCAICR